MTLDIKENISLADYSTMRVGGPARYLVHVKSKDQLVEAVEFARGKSLDLVIIGGGSNTIFSDKGFDGLVVVDEMKGIDVEEKDEGFLIKVAGGEVWDDVVAKSVELGLTGIESLSSIPGTMGAAVVQNIGAYGQEIANTFVELEAYDTKGKEFVILSKEQCEFQYRSSIFKFDHPKYEQGRYIIDSVTLALGKGNPTPPFYKDIEVYFRENGITEYSPSVLRKAVMEVRANKLPDPKKVPNTGSFFRNPIVSAEEFEDISAANPEVNEAPEGWPQPPRWILSDGRVKISAGWLVEQAGFSKHEDADTGMATWPKQSLTLVNRGAKTTADVVSYKDKIKSAVRDKFGIELEEEVSIV